MILRIYIYNCHRRLIRFPSNLHVTGFSSCRINIMIHSYLVCVRKGALSQQALGKALKINPQVSNLRTVQNSVTDPCQTKRPKHRRQNTFRRPPSKKPSESTSSLWAVLETKNVRLFVRLSWTWLQTNLHCTTAKMKCKNKSHCLFTFSLLTTKNNHVASTAFMAAFTMPLARLWFVSPCQTSSLRSWQRDSSIANSSSSALLTSTILLYSFESPWASLCPCANAFCV